MTARAPAGILIFIGIPSSLNLLICSSPVNHLLRRFSAAHAGIAQVFLLKRNAAGGSGNIFLDLVLALLTAAPHRFHKSRLLLNRLLELLIICRRICVSVSVSSSALKHILLN